MARRVLAEPRSFTPADRAVGVDARWHPSRVFLGRTGAPDHRRPSRPHSPLASVQLLVRGSAFSGEASWFVDPPYQNQGKHYHYGPENVDFAMLGNWCRTRLGQVIVCENEGADWLPFTPPSGCQDHARQLPFCRSSMDEWR